MQVLISSQSHYLSVLVRLWEINVNALKDPAGFVSHLFNKQVTDVCLLVLLHLCSVMVNTTTLITTVSSFPCGSAWGALKMNSLLSLAYCLDKAVKDQWR